MSFKKLAFHIRPIVQFQHNSHKTTSPILALLNTVKYGIQNKKDTDTRTQNQKDNDKNIFIVSNCLFGPNSYYRDVQIKVKFFLTHQTLSNEVIYSQKKSGTLFLNDLSKRVLHVFWVNSY